MMLSYIYPFFSLLLWETSSFHEKAAETKVAANAVEAERVPHWQNLSFILP